MLAWPGPWLRHRACARYRCKRKLGLALFQRSSLRCCSVGGAVRRPVGRSVAAVRLVRQQAAPLSKSQSHPQTPCATRRSAAKVSGTPLAGNKVASWRCTARTAASSTLTREATAWTRLRTAAHPAATCGNVQAGEPSGACGRKPSGCAGRRVRQMHGRRLPDHCGRCGRPESRARVRRFASSCTSCVGGSR